MTDAPRSSPTIYDVAALAGVSPSTVSRALNRPGRITAKTTERIRAAADELGFQFNPAARALLTGRTSTIGLVVADITNPVVFGIIRGAERACARAGYTLVIAESQEEGEREAHTARNLVRGVDGLVLASTRLDDAEVLELAAQRPLVLLNREVQGVEGEVPWVDPGNDALLDHLQQRGHRAIAYLGGPLRSWMNGRRWDSLFALARERGLSIFDIPGGTPSIEGGRDAYERVAASPATAVIAYNDLMAIGLMQAAQAAGARIPHDLAITGYDDIFGSTLTTPPLTTVSAPLERMAERAVATLLGEPVGDDPFRTELVVRGSS